MAMFAGAPIQVFKRYLFGSVFTGAPMQPFYPVQYNGYTYPLDGLSVSASAAFSTRKLRSAYAGKCMNVRRSSDNATQDIGFVNNVLDTASLLAFVGANNGFVTTWYDQSGNGYNVTQATATKQPQIVASGSIVAKNSLPTVDFTPSTTCALANATMPALLSTATTVNTVISGTLTGDSQAFIAAPGPNHCVAWRLAATGIFALKDFLNAAYAYPSGPTIAANTLGIFTGVSASALSGATISSAGTLNGNSLGTATGATFVASNAGLIVGNDAFPSGFYGQLSEVTVFGSALSTTDRQSLEHNQEAYYGIAGV